ncbi:MGMT family protein [Pseudoalteromonas sp. CnMc7-15]|uniref:MGMT family protein n=1 Tax=unclassified Pseudoalteromonas TaxID=194690 RepID=UPI001EF53BF6|nr:MGMT family protein [Pseudoalteromonas sp. CnMc7-15]MCG7565642.1 MGMT family protein [Pseudoalteromonas sp. CnMc7-15]
MDKAAMIYQVVAAIPKGKVCSYGEVAKRAGLPGYARYVGHTLKNLPSDSRLPWHRVVNSQGKISFAQGSDGFTLQQQALLGEGVLVIDGKVNMRRFAWHI